jgi:hypothetical protein
MHKLRTDEKGNIVTNPIVGWEFHSIANSAVMLVQSVSSADQLERGESNSIQYVLTPAQAVELAEALTRSGKALMSSDPSQKVQ